MIKGLEMRWSWMIWEDPYLSEGADEDGGRAWSAVATCQEHQESQKLTRQKGPSHRASGVGFQFNEMDFGLCPLKLLENKYFLSH